MENKRKTWQTEQNQNDICNQQSNRLILDKESSEESNEEKITIPRWSNRCNLCQDIRFPHRYGNVYTHLVDIFHEELVSENWPYRRGGMLWSVMSNGIIDHNTARLGDATVAWMMLWDSASSWIYKRPSL